MSYEGRTSSSTLRAPRPGNGNGKSNGKPQAAKGHDAVLKALQEDKREITISLSDGADVIGTVVARDKFTISVLVGETTFVIFKHAIVMFNGAKKSE